MQWTRVYLCVFRLGRGDEARYHHGLFVYRWPWQWMCSYLARECRVVLRDLLGRPLLKIEHRLKLWNRVDYCWIL